MKRFIPFFLTFVIVLSMVCIAAPSARAADEILDYNDYIVAITGDGTNSLVTVSFPVDNTLYYVYFNGELSLQARGSSINFVIGPENSYGPCTLTMYTPRFDATQIPDGTTFEMTFSVSSDWYDNYGYEGGLSYGSGACELRCYDTNKNLLTKSTIATYAGSGLNNTYHSYGTFSKIDDISYYRADWYFHDIVNETEYTQHCSVTFEEITLTMSLASLVVLEQMTGKTNEILSAVEDQLEAQGKTLEDILDTQEQTNEKLDDIGNTLDDISGAVNGNADPVAPDQSGTVDDVVDAEGELLADAQTRWEESQRVFDGFSLTLSTYGSTFLAVTAMLEKLFALDVFSMILYFSLSLGVLAVLLSIPMMVQSASRRKKGKGDG